MTWLPVETALLSERDRVLGLKPDVYDVLREMLILTWRITHARLLDLCRLRLAQMVGARAETAGADEQLLARRQPPDVIPLRRERRVHRSPDAGLAQLSEGDVWAVP